MTVQRNTVVCHALRLKQSEALPVYLFSLPAGVLADIATVSRISRGDDGKLEGYQRGLAQDHIESIAEYLRSTGGILPSAVVLALDSSVRFEERRGPGNDDGTAVVGRLSISMPPVGGVKPAWIVDGQQRIAALGKAGRPNFAVAVAAFVADAVELQRDQFIRVNSVRPLDPRLVTELLPEVAVPLSPRLSARQIPSALVDLLNSNAESPFRGLIRRPSQTPAQRRGATVQDTSLVAALQESLSSSTGVLAAYRNLATGQTDHDAVWWTIITYWSAVAEVFEGAWALPPHQSRLMHGVGVRSMARLMDRMMALYPAHDPQASSAIRSELERMAPRCHWTSGQWEELGGVAWNALENTPRDIRLLSNALVRIYTQTRLESL